LPRAAALFAVLALAAAAALALPRTVRAQATRADSAAILLGTARQFDAQGNRAAASAILEEILRRFPDTPAAEEARRWSATRPAEPERSGRLELMAWGLVYGAWLGASVPAAAGAENPNAYGIGLIVGAPAGFFLARSYVNATHPTLGQARAITLAFRWATWQAAGWYGTSARTVTTQGTFATLVAGGVAGAAATALYVRHRNVSPGAAASASHGSMWGTWFGVVGATLLDMSGSGGTQFVLLAGDAGLATAVITAPRDITTARVWMTSAGGLAGIAVGLGIDLLVRPGNDKTALAIPGVASALGLAIGARMAKGAERGAGDGGTGGATPGIALLEWNAEGARLGTPLVSPTLVPVGERGPRRLYRPALAVPLFHATF